MQIRKILLKKMLLPVDVDKLGGTQPYGWVPPGSKKWIGFGHFDEICTFPDEVGTDLTYIQQCRSEISNHNSEYEFFHPLFLIVPSSKASEIYEQEFWDKECWFLSVSRIHLSESSLPVEKFDTLAKAIEADLKDTNTFFAIYHSVELSDMVLVQKSNCLNDLTKQSLTLRKHKDVGRSYTYIGINHKYLIKNNFSDFTDKLPLFSMRFAVRNPNEAKKYIDFAINELGTCIPYSVAGVDDILINYQGLEVSKILQLFYKWFVSEDCGSKLLAAFSEVTTRIGTEYSQKNPCNENECKLYAECKGLLEIINHIAESDTEGRFVASGWFKPLSEICNALVRMSQTSVMDEFVYLLLPGVKAFLQHIEYRVKNKLGNNDSDAKVEEYNSMVNECSHLMEQIMRIEGQLSNQPELRPVVYDIPVFLLEYIMAFLNKVVIYLQKKDSPPDVSIKFLIVPSLCEHIASLEIFSANPEKQIPGLVLVKIPVKLLYDPKTVLMALCHETAHFVGENLRNREMRKKMYIQASATLLVNSIFKCNSFSLHKKLSKDISSRLEKYINPEIKDLKKQVLKFANEIVEDESKYIEYAWSAVCSSIGSERLFFLTQNERRNAFSLFTGQLNNLTILFKDIYADICMFHLLKLEPESYVNAVLDETYGEQPLEKMDRRSCNLAIRLYISILISQKYDCTQQIKVKQVHGKLWEDMCAYFKRIKPSGNSTIRFLIDYAGMCNHDLEGMSEYEELLSTIWTMYGLIKDDVDDYLEILKYIQQGRPNL